MAKVGKLWQRAPVVLRAASAALASVILGVLPCTGAAVGYPG